jgi:hypothetical protein
MDLTAVGAVGALAARVGREAREVHTDSSATYVRSFPRGLNFPLFLHPPSTLAILLVRRLARQSVLLR